MAPNVSEDEIDDLLYFARTGEKQEFDELTTELCKREQTTPLEVFAETKDEHSGNGALHMAAANGHAILIQGICKALSNPTPQGPAMLAIINAQNLAGNTPLHWAALNGHLEAVKVLLEQGGDPTITNQRGHDAVFEAELNDKTEVVEWVLKEGGEGLEEGFGGDAGEGEAEDNNEIEGTTASSSNPSETKPNEGDTGKVEEALAGVNLQSSNGSVAKH